MVRKQRVEHPGEGVEHPGPGPMGEAIAQLGRRFQVVDGQQGVLVAHVADLRLVELAGQPLPTVDVDLALIGDPALDAHVHEAELGVDQVEVVVQALALPAEELDGLGLMSAADLEGHARLHRADQAHDAFGDPVTLGDVLGQVVLLLDAVAGLDVVEGDHRTTGVGDQLAGVVGDALGGALGVVGEVGERHALGPQEAPGPVLLVERAQVALEDHAVEHRQAPGDALAVEILERPHGQPPCSSSNQHIECAAVAPVEHWPLLAHHRPEGIGPALPARHRPVQNRQGFNAQPPAARGSAPPGITAPLGCGRRLR